MIDFIIGKYRWQQIIINNVYPYYWISTNGDIYSEYIDAIMRPDFVGKGYLKVTLQTTDGPADFLIHRLVLLTFQPIPNSNDYIVNHKDAIKAHNYLDNLEWTDYSGNILHAYTNNLRPIGEEHNFAIYSEDQVRRICKQLENRDSYELISINVFGCPLYSKISATIGMIRRGKNWKHISKEYNIPSANRNTQYFTDGQIHFICRLFVEDCRIAPADVLSNLGINPYLLSSCERSNAYEIVNRIRRRERFTRISCNYSF